MHAHIAEINDAMYLARIHVLLLPLLILPLLDDFEAHSADLENRESVLFIGTQFSNSTPQWIRQPMAAWGCVGFTTPGGRVFMEARIVSGT